MAKGPPAADPRHLAWDVLIAVEGDAFADAMLGRNLTTADLAARDRALAVQLVYGTLAWQGLLDHILRSCGQTAAELDVPVRALLRLAMFQLVKLSRIPDYAAVDTAVELSKRFRHGAATKLVNAVLRRFLRQQKRFPLPSADTDPVSYLALTLSHPRWLVAHWLTELGRSETEALLRANNTPAPTVFRVNGARAARQPLLAQLRGGDVTAQATTFSPDGIVVTSGADPAAIPSSRQGLLTPQGEASQLVTWLLGIQPGQRILDACAAPGGKATHIAERLGGGGMVLAIDHSQLGLSVLRRRARCAGLTHVQITRADAADLPLASDQSFDGVLLDAPCSGLGTLRQHPEIKWRRRPASMAESATTQARLLAAVASHVRVGGTLVYATCTIASVENEQIVRNFLAVHPDFCLDDPTSCLPDAARSLIDERGFFRTFPHRDGMDGFFAARLKRVQELRMVTA